MSPRALVLVTAILVLACSVTPARPASVRVACIGDYGTNTEASRAVAELVDRWDPDLIVTTGDNTYDGTSIDENTGVNYSRYIGNYQGAYGSGAGTNRFFPSLGDHDWEDGAGIDGYLSYFTLPGSGISTSGTSGNERYYDFVRGPVHFFMIDSPSQEPDGVAAASLQAHWLKNQLAASASPWKLVLMHHPPYSSGRYGSQVVLQWPFQAWGASAVIASHDHVYERLAKDGFPIFINGLGGRALYGFGPAPLPGSAVRYNADYGAMRLDASPDSLVFSFYSIAGGSSGTRIDRWVMHSPPPPPPDVTLVPATAVWRYADSGVYPGDAWRNGAFDDSSWPSGPAELGYGDGGEATVVRCGASAPNCTAQNDITTWFRHRFQVPDPSLYIGLVLRVQRDDGAVVYLNGVEVLRTNMPLGPVTPSTPAASVVSGSTENKYVAVGMPVAFLQPGENVLAAELHQASAYTSDLSFSLELRGSQQQIASDSDPWTSATRGWVLEQSFPNPARPTAWIRYALPGSASVTLKLFDVSGRLVRTLAEGPRRPGEHSVSLDTSGLPPGIYLYRLESAGFRATRKLVVAR